MSIRDLLWLQVLFHRFIHTYEERSTRMNWCTSFLPYCAVSLRSAAIRSASAFIFARCSSESRCRASSRLMTSKNAAVCNLVDEQVPGA